MMTLLHVFYLMMLVDKIVLIDYFFFNSSYKEIDEISNAKSIVKIAKLIQESDLNMILYFHPNFILFPIYWKAKIYLSQRLITTNIKNFLSVSTSLDKKCFLHIMTAKQLYDLDEIWSHCVCEFFYKSQRFYYDPFLSRCVLYYPEIMSDYTIPSHEQILQMKIVSILIWR